MKISLILTNNCSLESKFLHKFEDYIYNPCLDLLDLINSYNAKITLFSNSVNFVNDKEVLQSQNQELPYHLISEKWKNILANTLESGNDAKLLISKKNDNYAYLNEEVENFEKFAFKYNSKYRANVFRIDENIIEDFSKIYQSLNPQNIKCDTSFNKFSNEIRQNNSLDTFLLDDKIFYKENLSDNTKEIKSLAMYAYKTSIPNFLKYLNQKLYYSIITSKAPSVEDLYWQRQNNYFISKRYPGFKSSNNKIFNFFKNDIIRLDYNQLASTVFVEFLALIIEEINQNPNIYQGKKINIVANGSIANAFDNQNLEKILILINENFKDEIIFQTISQAIA